MPERPPVSVLVPFAGDAGEARELLDALLAIERRPGDELVIADNTADGVLTDVARGTDVRVVPSRRERSSYASRNVAAAHARNDWLLFTDADCRPRPDILDRYLDEPVGDDVGALAGPVLPVIGRRTWISVYAESRQRDKQEMHLRNAYKPLGVTANLLVRRAAYDAVGGFQEGIRSGGDADFNWRVQDAGWRVDYRPGASVGHLQRETLRTLVRQNARYGAGRRWLLRRHPGSGMRPVLLKRLARCAAGVVVWPLAGRPRRGLHKALDALVITAESAGYLLDNVPLPGPDAPRRPAEAPGVVLLVPEYPGAGSTDVAREAASLVAVGHAVRIESVRRAEHPATAPALALRHLEDDGIARTGRDLAWLLARHPLRSLRDAAARRDGGLPLRRLAPAARRIARSADVAVHGVGAAGHDARRLARLAGVPVVAAPAPAPAVGADAPPAVPAEAVR